MVRCIKLLFLHSDPMFFAPPVLGGLPPCSCGGAWRHHCSHSNSTFGHCVAVAAAEFAARPEGGALKVAAGLDRGRYRHDPYARLVDARYQAKLQL